jgi:hypothetical protein
MKSKRVLTILLSLAIMLTFMPSMAFAADSDPHHWQPDAAKTIAATCQHDGLLVESCTGETFGDEDNEIVLPCEAIKTTYQAMLTSCTPKANPIQLSKADYLVRLATECGYTEAQIKALAESNTACYVFVKECKDCGRVIPSTEQWENHKKPAGTADCAISYVCDFCGQTVYTGVETGDSVHNYERKLIGENWCSDGSSANAGYDVYEYTCKNCGDTYRTFESANWVYIPFYGDYQAPPTGVKHEKLTKIVYRDADCTNTGEYAEKCETCGMVIRHLQGGRPQADWVIPVKGHDYATINVPATCTERGYTIETCKVCGATVHKAYTDDPLGHDYVVRVISEPNCDAPGITQIYCSRCDAVADAEAGFADLAYAKGLIRDVDKDGYVIDAPAKDSKLYLVGLTNEFVDTHGKVTKDAIEIKDWKQGAHDWGQYESMTVADCTHGGFQAKKCKICGHFDPHTAKETGDPVGHKWVTVSQDPTCGAKGFTVQRCAVCGEQNGPVVRWGEPKVSYGAKCDFSEWVVETEPTPFKEGTKKLICSVCGDDGHLAVVNGEVKEVGVTRANIAKKTIAAPKVKALKKKAKVTVKAVDGAVQYQILVNGKVSKTVKKAGTFTVKKGIKASKKGKKNTFKIRAINADGVKATSKAKSVKIKK